MNPKKNKVLSEYFKKIEKAEQAVLQSDDTDAVTYLLKDRKISDKSINYLFQFAKKKYKMIFLDNRKSFTPAEQCAICTFGSAEMIKKLIGTLRVFEPLHPNAEKILLGSTKQASLYYYISYLNHTLAPENLLQFFQTADALLIEDYFRKHKCISIDKTAFIELVKRGLGNLFTANFDNCCPTKEALLAVFESDMEELKTKIIQHRRLTVQFDADFIKKYDYDSLMKYPFSLLTTEAQKILYEQDKDRFWTYCLSHKINVIDEYQEELRTDKNREKLWQEWLKKGFVTQCILKNVILHEPRQLPLYIKHNPNMNWPDACLIISHAPAPIAKEMAKKSAHPDCRKAYKKRFNWFQRTFG